jgi:DNA-binding transcriptional regulator YdaS (Cro superfamily)
MEAFMRLRDYLYFNDLTKKGFAATLELSPVYVQRICKGLAIPSRKVCRAISRATHGQVTEKDLVPAEKEDQQQIAN